MIGKLLSFIIGFILGTICGATVIQLILNKIATGGI